MAIEGKTIRLRASCNACSEYKVRCSQHKPTCARCERNGTKCTYGLSRRTHKDAPPISMPPSRRRPRNSSNANITSDSESHGSSISENVTDYPSNSNASRDRSARIHDAPLFPDYIHTAWPYLMVTSQAPIAPEPAIQPSQLLPEFDGMVGTPSAPTKSVQRNNSQVPGSIFSGDHISRGVAASDTSVFDVRQLTPKGPKAALPLLENGKCHCHVRVTELLASIRRSDDEHRRLSLDTQLARLMECIASSKKSLECKHGNDDFEPIHIMLVTTLISYVVNEFEILAIESQPQRPASSQMSVSRNIEREGSLSHGSDESMCEKVARSIDLSLGAPVNPELPWDNRELEEEGEADLRLRLCVLSFRKLEKLLRQLMICLQNLYGTAGKGTRPSRHTGFIIACDYTRLWLERKVEDVKRLVLAAAGGGRDHETVLI